MMRHPDVKATLDAVKRADYGDDVIAYLDALTAAGDTHMAQFKAELDADLARDLASLNAAAAEGMRRYNRIVGLKIASIWLCWLLLVVAMYAVGQAVQP